MNQYEILLLLDPELAEERQTEILQRTRELVERGGGSWEAHEPWGRRRLAYEIDKKGDGVYHLLTFASDPGALEEVSRVLKITDGVMRHMPIRRPGTRPAETLAAVPPSVQDGGAPEAPPEEGESWQATSTE